jgi:hypothetical protein
MEARPRDAGPVARARPCRARLRDRSRAPQPHSVPRASGVVATEATALWAGSLALPPPARAAATTLSVCVIATVTGVSRQQPTAAATVTGVSRVTVRRTGYRARPLHAAVFTQAAQCVSRTRPAPSNLHSSLQSGMRQERGRGLGAQTTQAAVWGSMLRMFTEPCSRRSWRYNSSRIWGSALRMFGVRSAPPARPRPGYVH